MSYSDVQIFDSLCGWSRSLNLNVSFIVMLFIQPSVNLVFSFKVSEVPVRTCTWGLTPAETQYQVYALFDLSLFHTTSTVLEFLEGCSAHTLCLPVLNTKTAGGLLKPPDLSKEFLHGALTFEVDILDTWCCQNKSRIWKSCRLARFYWPQTLGRYWWSSINDPFNTPPASLAYLSASSAQMIIRSRSWLFDPAMTNDPKEIASNLDALGVGWLSLTMLRPEAWIWPSRAPSLVSSSTKLVSRIMIDEDPTPIVVEEIDRKKSSRISTGWPCNVSCEDCLARVCAHTNMLRNRAHVSNWQA